jgi:hypothetical protein
MGSLAFTGDTVRSIRSLLPSPWRDASAQSRSTRRVFQRRRLALAVLAVGLIMLVLWQGVRRLSWVGPLIADSLRSLVGVEAVAALEELVAGAEDSLKQRLGGDAPRDYAEVVQNLSATSTTEVALTNTRQASELKPGSRQSAEHPSPRFSFVPTDLAPMFPAVAAPSDGQWMPLRVPGRDSGSAQMYLTLLHPDRKRPYAELFVVAVDLDRTRLHAVAGTREPKPSGAAAKGRAGLIPKRQHARLLGAFNGGFKAVHGGYGMQVDAKTLLAPKSFACTIAAHPGGRIEIGTWSNRAFASQKLSFWRQTPPCLYENGQMHKGLSWDDSRAWGAALKGNTVIRRSALGLSRDGRTLYVGISNATTARTLADGMRHAGAWNVAQLDINWSYPKFVVFSDGDGATLQAQSLIDGFLVRPEEYVKAPSTRDFFYLVRH